MSTPTIQILVGFQTTAGFGNPFQLDNATYGVLDTGTLGGVQLVDVTSMAEAITINRGRNRELEQFNAGTASIRFSDPQRYFDPLNASSPYYPFVGPRNPVQVLADGIPRFTGVITDWNLDYAFVTDGNVTTAQCSDVFTVLANQNMNEWTPGAESSGDRVDAVLDLPEIEYQGGRSIDAGSSTLGAYQVAAGTNVLQYLQNVTTSEQGYLFINASGVLVFKGRETALNPVATVEFKDDGSGVKYQSLTNAYGDELLYNYVATQSPAGAVQTTSDATSVALYNPQQWSKLDLLNSSTAEVAGLGNYVLGRYAYPVLRFTGVSIQLAGCSSGDCDDILSTDLTSIVSVEKTFDSGSPGTVTQTLITSGISEEITPGSHVVTFTFESTDANAYFTLNSAVFGVLDQNLLAF